MNAPPLSPPLFAESQRMMRYWWGTTLLGPLMALGLWCGGIATHHGWGDVAALAAVALLPGVLLWPTQLHTRLDADGVRYRFPPFLSQWRFVPWGQIRRGYVRTYSPLNEYGGWGYKGGFGEGSAYNVWGTQGLQLVLTTGERLLLGTQRPAEIQQVLAELQIVGPRETALG